MFDLWARRREAPGDVIIVGYADDIVVGFEHEDMPEACFQQDARRFGDAMQKRFEEFALRARLKDIKEELRRRRQPCRHPQLTDI